MNIKSHITEDSCQQLYYSDNHLSVVASTVAARPLQDPSSDQYALEAACALPGDDDGITAPAGPRKRRSNNDKKCVFSAIFATWRGHKHRK